MSNVRRWICFFFLRGWNLPLLSIILILCFLLIWSVSRPELEWEKVSVVLIILIYTICCFVSHIIKFATTESTAENHIVWIVKFDVRSAPCHVRPSFICIIVISKKGVNPYSLCPVIHQEDNIVIIRIIKIDQRKRNHLKHQKRC